MGVMSGVSQQLSHYGPHNFNYGHKAIMQFKIFSCPRNHSENWATLKLSHFQALNNNLKNCEA